jgi:putative ABC transport system permease protein
VPALGAAKALSGALYGVSFLDPVPRSAAVAVPVTVATLANLVPAHGASAVDPSTALRTD